MDTSLIERMARLRGIGDAYHDYRGELRYFSVETKTHLLRAMGCAVDDQALLANEFAVLDASRRQLLLPPLAAARGSRIGIELNIPARDFGSSMTWTVKLEDGGRREGTVSTTDCRGSVAPARYRARGTPGGVWSCRWISRQVITSWTSSSPMP